jgi:hypothetical protein
MERFNRGYVRLAAGALMLAAVAAGSGAAVHAQEEAAGQQSYRPPRGAMIAPGKTADLTLLYTGDVIGYIDPCG